MKNLFVDEKPVDPNQTLAPGDGSVAVVFGSPGWIFFIKNTDINKNILVQEKVAEKNPFAGDQKSIVSFLS